MTALKPTEKYSLNDVVHFAEWELDDTEFWQSVRYTGFSGDGTIKFHVTQGSAEKPATTSMGMGNFVRVPPRPPNVVRWTSEIAALAHGVAPAAWRTGPSSTDVASHFYVLGEEGELIEVERPEEVKAERRIGFRQFFEGKQNEADAS